MLRDRGVRRTGKEGADNAALTGGAGLCGPDGHAMKARFELERLDQRRHAEEAQNPGVYVAGDWQARDKLYSEMQKLNKRRYRGGASFSPQDAC